MDDLLGLAPTPEDDSISSPSFPFFSPPYRQSYTETTSSTSAGVIAGAVIGSVLGVSVIVVLVIFWVRRRRKLKASIRDADQFDPFKGKPIFSVSEDFKVSIHPTSDSRLRESTGSVTSTSSAQSSTPMRNGIDSFTFEELKEASNGFSKGNLVGKGGYGFVYKGTLSNGKLVAIKQLKVGSFQGDREFMAEIETISRIHHRNLVSLVGYSIDGTENLLVYDYLPNNSLAYHLHASEAPILSWDTRMQIGLGGARGIAYLHEDCDPKIIHRDIKATNILLDSNFKAKVSDFGLARFVSEAETHVTTRVMGTLGYLAPEYASSGKLTEKSDVYSFGIVLLELISGRDPLDLVEWAWPLLDRALESGTYDDLVDPKLGEGYNMVEMGRMVACAEASIHHHAIYRPKMIEIARVLEGVMPPNELKKKNR